MSPTTSTLAVIYECPDCETRYLDERRCPDCHLFTRRIDAGPLDHLSDEPVALTDLNPHEGTMTPT